MPIVEHFDDVDKELHPYKIPPFNTKDRIEWLNNDTRKWNAEHPNSQMKLYPEDRIVSDKIYAELMKKEKEAYAMGWEKSVLWEMFMHSNRKDLLKTPLEKILEEMEKVDPKTLTRGWD
ncbi:MAG: hypothetical protein IKD09_02250 [Lentisphaeria bacterium]|nr:hypothetical protein [Lentisphaeria bacterium]